MASMKCWIPRGRQNVPEGVDVSDQPDVYIKITYNYFGKE